MSFGVKWLSSPSVFSPGSGTIDLSSHGVPTDATFAILYQLGGDANTDDVYYYKVGGSHSGSNPNVKGDSLQTIIVPLVNAQVECVENGIGNAYVAGYGYGGYWPSGKTSRSTSTTGTWVDKSVAAALPNAKLVCWEAYSVNGFFAGVREKGSTDTFTPAPLYHYWAYCGADASQVCQIYDGFDASHYVYGAFLTTDTGLKVNTNWVNIPTTATGWQTYDASAGITAGHNAVLLFFTGFTGSHTYGVRKVGSSFTTTGEGCSGGAFAMVELDSSGQFEAYISDTSIDIYVVASFPEFVNSRTYPSDNLTRVTGLRHLYRPGSYRLEIRLGGLSVGEPVLGPEAKPEEPAAPKPEAPLYEPPPTDWSKIPPYEPGPYQTTESDRQLTRIPTMPSLWMPTDTAKELLSALEVDQQPAQQPNALSKVLAFITAPARFLSNLIGGENES